MCEIDAIDTMLLIFGCSSLRTIEYKLCQREERLGPIVALRGVVEAAEQDGRGRRAGPEPVGRRSTDPTRERLSESYTLCKEGDRVACPMAVS